MLGVHPILLAIESNLSDVGYHTTFKAEDYDEIPMLLAADSEVGLSQSGFGRNVRQIYVLGRGVVVFANWMLIRIPFEDPDMLSKVVVACNDARNHPPGTSVIDHA